MSPDRSKVNPDLIVGEGIDEDSAHVFYEGDKYKIFGKLGAQLETLGVLSTEDPELIKQLYKNRERVEHVLDSDKLLLSHIILAVPHEKPQAVVELPPDGYVCLDDLMKDKDNKVLAMKILEREKSRDIYKPTLEARDLWVGPQNTKVFSCRLR